MQVQDSSKCQLAVSNKTQKNVVPTAVVDKVTDMTLPYIASKSLSCPSLSDRNIRCFTILSSLGCLTFWLEYICDPGHVCVILTLSPTLCLSFQLVFCDPGHVCVILTRSIVLCRSFQLVCVWPWPGICNPDPIHSFVLAVSVGVYVILAMYV